MNLAKAACWLRLSHVVLLMLVLVAKEQQT
jgi:hypothetical protein